MSGIDREILEHYGRTDEAGRLTEGFGPLEQARTRRILTSHLPPPPARIIDIGGGPGAYSSWLAGLGYDIVLVDPVPKHVAEAAELARATGVRIEARVADALALPFPDADFDAGLVMGPLYHLQDESDRRAALGEASRVTRNGGPILAAGISRFAPLMSALTEGFTHNPSFDAILDRDLADGRHTNTTGDDRYFTTAYFHTPAGLREDMRSSGLLDVRIEAVEGIGWALADFDDLWQDEAIRTRVLDLIERTATAPSILGASFHLMGIGTVGTRAVEIGDGRTSSDRRGGTT